MAIYEKDLNNKPQLIVTMGVKRSIADLTIIILAGLGVFLALNTKGAGRILGIISVFLALFISFWRRPLYGLLKKIGL